jgi:hypothetical protein
VHSRTILRFHSVHTQTVLSADPVPAASRVLILVAVVNTFTTSSPRKKPFIDYVPEVTTSRLRSAPRIDYSSLHAPPRETPESQLPSESPATANSSRHTSDDPEPASPTRLVRTMSGHSNPTESEDEEESRPPRRTVKYTVAQTAALHEMELESRRLDNDLKRAKLERLRNAPLPREEPSGLNNLPINEEVHIGEQPLVVQEACLLWPSLPRFQIVAIFNKKFQAVNIARLRLNFSRREIANTLQIGTSGDIEVRSTRASDKEFGKDSSIWSESFLNYVVVIHHFYKRQHPNLMTALLQFHTTIIVSKGEKVD